MIKRFSLNLFFALLITVPASAQSMDVLRHQLAQIVAGKKAFVGVAIAGNDGTDTLSLHGDSHFPLQSVFKFHIALAMLAQVDKGNFSLGQHIKIEKKDLLPKLYSPIMEKYPEGTLLTIAEIIEYAVAQSDNVACDVLLKLLGGPEAVETYIRKNGITNVSIKINEAVQQSDRNLQFQNWTTPAAANDVLSKYYNNTGKLLSQKSYDFIWRVMKKTETGKARLKGQLPEHTTVAHKTGTSGTNKGVTSAVNDIGIVFLPGGKYFFISVFVSNSAENEATNEKIIAAISKAAWVYFKGNSL